jgi:hypothetical protein
MAKKIMVCNTSGNCGKSTICRHLLYGRLDNPKIIEIEGQNSSSINFKNLNIEKFAGNADFLPIYENLIDEDLDLIIDVGASEILNFFENLQDFESALDLFDVFIVPTKPTQKIAEDTVKTVFGLIEFGVDKDKIKIIFNDFKGDVKNIFSVLLNNFDYPFNYNLAFRSNPFFKDLDLLKITFLEVLNSDEDFRKKMLLAKDPLERKKFLKLDMIKTAAQKVGVEHDNIFAELFPSFKPKIEPKKAENKKEKVAEKSVKNENEKEINPSDFEDL